MRGNGAWFIFNYDWNAYPIGLFGDELEARRFADGLGYETHVEFWLWGSWDDHNALPRDQRMVAP